MAVMTVPSNVVSITFTSSGLITTAGGKISGITQAEMQEFLGGSQNGIKYYGEWRGFKVSGIFSFATGNMNLVCPKSIQNIDLGPSGNFGAVGTGNMLNVPATDVNLLCVNPGFKYFSA